MTGECSRAIGCGDLSSVLIISIKKKSLLLRSIRQLDIADRTFPHVLIKLLLSNGVPGSDHDPIRGGPSTTSPSTGAPSTTLSHYHGPSLQALCLPSPSPTCSPRVAPQRLHVPNGGACRSVQSSRPPPPQPMGVSASKQECYGAMDVIFTTKEIALTHLPWRWGPWPAVGEEVEHCTTAALGRRGAFARRLWPGHFRG